MWTYAPTWWLRVFTIGKVNFVGLDVDCLSVILNSQRVVSLLELLVANILPDALQKLLSVCRGRCSHPLAFSQSCPSPFNNYQSPVQPQFLHDKLLVRLFRHHRPLRIQISIFTFLLVGLSKMVPNDFVLSGLAFHLVQVNPTLWFLSLHAFNQVLKPMGPLGVLFSFKLSIAD